MSRSLIHVLLSLLLLVSQQLSLGHGYTHWSAQTADIQEMLDVQAANAPLDDGTGKLPKPALHDLCGQCAASAQVAFALPVTIRQFVPAELAYAAPSVHVTPGNCLAADCPYEGRGPPRA